MLKIPTMSLKTAQFQPAVFTPSQYEYQAADMGLLERSLAQREARMKEAAQSKNAIDQTLAGVELQLNPTEAEWFEGYKQDIRNQIQSSIDSGDYGAAIRNASMLAGSTAQDPRLLGRIRSNEAYQNELKTQQARRDRGEISQNTYDWWVANNKYSYTDATDGNGNFVEASPWKAQTRPVSDINWAEQATIAFKTITPKKRNNSKSGGSNTTNVDGTGSGNKWSNTDNTEEITVEDILTNIDELLSATPDGYRRAEQAYNVARFDYDRLIAERDALPDGDPEKERLTQQIDARDKLMNRNGSPISYKEYYARMITDNRYAHTLAYNWTTTGRDSFNSNDYKAIGSGASGSLNRGSLGAFNSNPFGFWKGSNVRWGGTYNFGFLNGAANGISTRFGNQ